MHSVDNRRWLPAEEIKDSEHISTNPAQEVASPRKKHADGAQRLKSNVIVVKAQIHAGGRGKAVGRDETE